jgi:vitamin B12 transporter
MRRAGVALLAAVLGCCNGWSNTALASEDDDDPPIEVVSSSDSPIAEQTDPTPAVYVLRGDALEAAGSGVADVLARVPGMETTRSGGSADFATVSVRGATSAQTPIYLGGVRLNDELTGTVDLSTLPLWMLRRIEVYRGNAPLAADQLGMGGAIFLEPDLPHGPHVVAGLGLGSFGEREARAAIAMGAATRAGSAGALFGLRHRSADGNFTFEDDGGTRFDTSDDVMRRRENADHTETDVWAIGRVEHGDVRLITFVNTYNRDAGAPGLQLFAARLSRSKQRRVIAGASSEIPCADDCSVFVDIGALLSRYRLSDPRRELGAATSLNNAGERYTQRVRLAARAATWLRVGLGASRGLQLLRLDVEGAPVQRARRDLLRAEANGIVEPHEDVAIVAVGALSCHSTTAGGLLGAGEGRLGRETCGVLAPVGRVGARWLATSFLSLSLNAGRYVRVPTLGELYGTSAVVRGNADLEEERGTTIDAHIAVQEATGPLDMWLQVAGFVRFADGLIGFRRSSLGVIRPYNVASARVLGVETAVGATLWRVIELGASLSALDPRDTASDTLQNDLLPLHSRLSTASSVALIAPPGVSVSLDRARLEARLLHRSSRVADPAGLIVLDEHRQLDLSASLAFAERLALSGRVANVIDDRNVDLIGYPLPGRSFHMLLESWF